MRRMGHTAMAVALGLALGAPLGGCGGCPDEDGVACIWAGTGRLGLGADGQPATETSLYWAIDVSFAPDDTPYLLDWNNHLIRRMEPDGTLTTVMGEFVGDGPEDESDLEPPGAPGLDVRLNHPTDIVFDDEGLLIVAAWHNHKIRTYDVDSDRVIVMAGRGPGFRGDEGTLDDARFNQPKALARRADGTLYILDQRNHRIRCISPDGSVSTVVGTGENAFGGDGGPPSEARLSFETGGNPEPSGGLALDSEGRLYIADGLNHRIRRVDFDLDLIETVVGTGEAGFAGDGGAGLAAQVNHVRDLEFGPDGRLYFADTENHRIRVWDPTEDRVETVVGSGAEGMGAEGQAATEIALSRPMGIAFDSAGVLYVADTYNSRFLRVPR